MKRSKFLPAELTKKKNKIMHELRPRLKMKRTPKLEFLPYKEDKTERVINILDSL